MCEKGFIMLTGEQVRKAIYDCSEYPAFDGTDYYAGGIHMQELADKLNAMLDSGECKITTSATDGLCGDDPKVYYELSCGHRIMLYGLDVPIRCAVCGKVVEQ